MHACGYVDVHSFTDIDATFIAGSRAPTYFAGDVRNVTTGLGNITWEVGNGGAFSFSSNNIHVMEDPIVGNILKPNSTEDYLYSAASTMPFMSGKNHGVTILARASFDTGNSTGFMVGVNVQSPRNWSLKLKADQADLLCQLDSYDAAPINMPAVISGIKNDSFHTLACVVQSLEHIPGIGGLRLSSHLDNHWQSAMPVPGGFVDSPSGAQLVIKFGVEEMQLADLYLFDQALTSFQIEQISNLLANKTGVCNAIQTQWPCLLCYGNTNHKEPLHSQLSCR
jgi:hypothetical protein